MDPPVVSFDYYPVGNYFEVCGDHVFNTERGITDITLDVLDSLTDEAWDTCPPDKSIDFRMSVNKKNRYRVNAE